MLTWLSVAIGGALGALARYGISKIPILQGSTFSWMTLAANVIGALIIGFVAGLMLSSPRLTPEQTAFLKTGFCGGLTTFSTFSLETVSLFETGKWGIACVYIFISMILCLGGVILGKILGEAY
jgi:CrcB protein